MISEYSIFLIALLLVLSWLVIMIYWLRRKDREKRSLLDYIFLWPLLLEQHKAKASKNSNRFIVIGLIIMALLVTMDMLIIHPKEH